MSVKNSALNSPNRAAKQQRVSDFDTAIKEADTVIVAHQLGLNADQSRNMRIESLKSGVAVKVEKNKLIKHAIKDTKFACLEKFLTGPTVLAFAKDPVSVAKMTVEFAKKNQKFKIVGGVMGDQLLEAAQVNALATLPSLDQLRAKLVGLLQAPATRIAGVLVAPAAQLARVMSARSKQEA